MLEAFALDNSAAEQLAHMLSAVRMHVGQKEFHGRYRRVVILIDNKRLVYPSAIFRRKLAIRFGFLRCGRTLGLA